MRNHEIKNKRLSIVIILLWNAVKHLPELFHLIGSYVCYCKQFPTCSRISLDGKQFTSLNIRAALYYAALYLSVLFCRLENNYECKSVLYWFERTWSGMCRVKVSLFIGKKRLMTWYSRITSRKHLQEALIYSCTLLMFCCYTRLI